jgi:hypothetical protein
MNMDSQPMPLATHPIQPGNAVVKSNIWLLGLFFILFILICTVSPLSLITFGFLALLMWLLFLIHRPSRIVHRRAAAFAFLFYSICALLLFHAQRFTLPEWDGLSGPEGGIGTDDTFYYTQATGDVDLSRNGAVRAMAFIVMPSSYSLFLQKIVWFTAKYKQPHLIDLLIWNAFALSFVPLFCILCVQICMPDWKGSEGGRGAVSMAYWLSLLNPFLWLNGLILVRDGWTAVLFIAAVAALLHASYIRYILSVVFLSYFRVASGITLVLCTSPLVWPLGRRKMGKNAPFLLATFVLLALIMLFYAVRSGYVEQRSISFLRNDFVEGFLGQSADVEGSSSALYRISILPVYLRIPLCFTYFLCVPFIVLNYTCEGILIPRLILTSLAGVFNFLLLKWWVQSLVVSWRGGNHRHFGVWFNLHIGYMVGILLLSTMSLQFRHKTMLIPLLCVLAAHGATVKDPRARSAGMLVMLAFGFGNAAKILLSL